MPQQSIFLDKRTESKRVQVLKVYDAAYAHSCFDEMDADALAFLSKSLDLESKYELTEPYDLTWEEVEDEAREDGNVVSFFIVLDETQGHAKPLYVSPDWPSAEAFAERQL